MILNIYLFGVLIHLLVGNYLIANSVKCEDDKLDAHIAWTFLCPIFPVMWLIVAYHYVIHK